MYMSWLPKMHDHSIVNHMKDLAPTSSSVSTNASMVLGTMKPAFLGSDISSRLCVWAFGVDAGLRDIVPSLANTSSAAPAVEISSSQDAPLSAMRSVICWTCKSIQMSGKHYVLRAETSDRECFGSNNIGKVEIPGFFFSCWSNHVHSMRVGLSIICAFFVVIRYPRVPKKSACTRTRRWILEALK